MITSGYIFGPSGAPNAQAVQFDPSNGNIAPASVRLLATYWPVGTPFTRPSWANGVLPYSVGAGVCIMVPGAEAAALLALGVAVAV